MNDQQTNQPQMTRIGNMSINLATITYIRWVGDVGCIVYFENGRSELPLIDAEAEELRQALNGQANGPTGVSNGPTEGSNGSQERGR